ncbi:MAG: Zn-dependent hydrolase [Xanthomonadales bacterium]|nr:Zn-dependent hydrolase [Xanthomonadales bacterium]
MPAWSLMALALLALPEFVPAREAPEVSAELIAQRIAELSAFGRNADGGVDRVAYSQPDLDARQYIQGLMKQAGLDVRIDTAGNIIGRRAGSRDLPPLMIGSHIDSVPGGGNYDGDVGVIGAIEVARVLNEGDVQLAHPLEVVVFADEEGGLTGSRGMIGDLTPAALEVMSHSGLTVAEGIARIGGDPGRLGEAAREHCSLAGFVELHIEQGAILDDEDIDIGVVTGIVGIRWWDVTIDGIANHAGTTPMDKRRDPMLAAADFINAVNRVIRSEPGAQVGTVGRIKADPGAPNVIPDKVTLSLEIRDLDSGTMQKMFDNIRLEAREIAKRHLTPIEFREIDVASPPAPTDPRVQDIIAQSAEALGLSHKHMPSGAGHDAQDLARITPTGMIFVPSVGGISHSPKEYTAPQDMANGANVLLHTVLALDQSPPECAIGSDH